MTLKDLILINLLHSACHIALLLVVDKGILFAFRI